MHVAASRDDDVVSVLIGWVSQLNTIHCVHTIRSVSPCSHSIWSVPDVWQCQSFVTNFVLLLADQPLKAGSLEPGCHRAMMIRLSVLAVQLDCLTRTAPSTGTTHLLPKPVGMLPSICYSTACWVACCRFCSAFVLPCSHFVLPAVW